MEETFTGTISMAKSVWKSFEMLIRGRFHLSDAVLNIVFFMALITVNLGIVNMLPFPALDGGRFVFLLIEAIIRRPLPRKLEYIVNGIGLALLILFIIFISINDITKLINGTFPSIS